MFKIFSFFLSLLSAGVILHNPIEGVAEIDQKRQRAACSYALSPAGKAFDSEGGAGRISVAATGNCTWRAVSSAPAWLTVTSGASGAGNGTVGYRVAPNTGVSRSGTVTVAGRTFTVDQTASPCCEVSAHGSAPPTPLSTDRRRSGEGT
ncbi:MAG: BACON domain-containing protein [Thermodesulfobacteriota bacterium]